MKSHIVTFLVGFLFSLGFGFGEVTRPETIIGFLDVTGDWKPNVLIVISSAVVTTFILYKLSFRRKAPLLAPKFMVPTRRDIDPNLVLGAALFGAGWGLVGLCPGPALAAVTSKVAPTMIIFIASLTSGMLLYRFYEQWQEARKARAA